MLDSAFEQEPISRDVELVHLDVSGKRFSLPRATIYKYPFSRLADISCATSPEYPGFVDMDADVRVVGTSISAETTDELVGVRRHRQLPTI
jgi:hypothetical protein